jgi:hypothetical protein
MPAFHKPAPEGQSRYSYYERYDRPTTLSLFFPQYYVLPTDLRRLLLDFVPRPAGFTIPSLAELPATFPQTRYRWEGNKSVEETADVPLRVRETAREAEHGLKAVLRLIEAGRVRVSDKKRQPTAASVQALAPVLQGGDFYSAEDQDPDAYDPSADLTIKAFAWPMIVQAAGLAEKSGDNLKLTPAGQKVLAKLAHETLRAAWRKWRTTSLLDEFSRVETIKGQGKAGLSAVANRRKTVGHSLAECPVGRWVAVDDFFRFLRATDRDFVLARQTYELYIAEHYYGNLGYDSVYAWEQLQGRYILAFLFEYAATLGLIDVAYLPPQGERRDFQDRWGTDELSCLSRYDGLLYFRLNALGAWCLDQAEHYELPALPVAQVIQVLPNLEVVARQPPLAAADRLLLDRFAEPQSEAVWRRTADKILSVLEAGGSLEELAEFLTARSAAPLPQTVQVFLDDLKQRAGQLRDLGLARLVECADAAVAQLLVTDRQLRDKCWLAGERWLVFRTADEAAVKRGLRRLGYLLPPPRE